MITTEFGDIASYILSSETQPLIRPSYITYNIVYDMDPSKSNIIKIYLSSFQNLFVNSH